MNIDLTKFMINYRQHLGAVFLSSQMGLEQLLKFIMADEPLWANVSPKVGADRAAYLLATAKHETGDKYAPIDERGNNGYFENRYGFRSEAGKRLGNTQPGDGGKFHGRGYVQLTGKTNYVRATSDLLTQYPATAGDYEQRARERFDLAMNPNQAKDPTIAYCIMSFGMRHGRFTGRSLSQYFTETTSDALNARRVVNGLDRAEMVARYWQGIAHALRQSIVT